MSVKSLSRKRQDYTDLLRDDEDPFSTNKVTRWSLNVPIVATCMPSVVCADTCYFAKGAVDLDRESQEAVPPDERDQG